MFCIGLVGKNYYDLKTLYQIVFLDNLCIESTQIPLKLFAQHITFARLVSRYYIFLKKTNN